MVGTRRQLHRLRTIMTIRLFGAIKDGVRDPEQLVLEALGAVKDLY